MRIRIIRIKQVILLLIAVCLISFPVYAQYNGGTGEPNNPYKIAEPNDWVELMNTSTDWDKNFIMTADIDMNGVSLTPVGTSSSSRFTGIFDGNGHIIYNAYVNMPSSDYVGLFGYTSSAGQICNLGTMNTTITGKKYVGGLVGRNYAALTGCYSTGMVNSEEYAGGLVGINSGGNVVNSYSNTDISGQKKIGGLVGYNTDNWGTKGRIINCYSTGSVVGNSDSGGLLGLNSYGQVYSSFWDIQASGQSTSDGGFGKTTSEMRTSSIYANWGRDGAWTIEEGNDYPRLTWENKPGELITTIYNGGSGTQVDPYLIYTAEMMNQIGLYQEDWDKHFKLMADIDLSAYTGTSFNMIGFPGESGVPKVPFTGVFDGNGHIISNFNYIHNSIIGREVGIFSLVDSPNALIKDLGVMNPVINAEDCDCVGSIVGSLLSGTVKNCYTKGGSISGDWYIGGLVGDNRGIITNCSTTVSVSGLYHIGGLAGRHIGPNSYITNCFSNGDTLGSYGCVGGLIGINYRNVFTCRTTGVVSCKTDGGGLVGKNESDATISGCYSHADVSGQERIGGLVGKNEARITTCYSAGPVTGITNVGGLVGLNDGGQVYSSFWDIEISGQSASDGGWGKTSIEMQKANTFTGWAVDAIWTIDEGNDYPRLVWENMPGMLIDTLYGGGSGTKDDPYLIYTPEQLGTISTDANDWDKHFKLMVDLDLTGMNINPIGYWTQAEEEDEKPFSGTFNGNGHSIINFKCTYPGGADGWNPSSTGLFRYISGKHAEVRDLTLIDPNIDGGSWSGTLVGFLDGGTINNCTVIGGSVTGSSYVGGLIGFATNHGYVEYCHSSASVIGFRSVGGLVGDCIDEVLISNCSASGIVIATGWAIGGLIGNGGSLKGGCIIMGCFANGNVFGNERVGGLVGSPFATRIICSYAMGDVSANKDLVGGLIGFPVNGPYIRDSYSTGQVSGTGDDIGGLAGNDWGTVYDCFWDTDTSEIATGGNGTGLTTLQMQDPNTFISAGWDFMGESDNGLADIWVFPDGGGYPILWWQLSSLPPLPTFSGGTGEPNDPYIITTAEELNSIGGNPRLMRSHFKLDNNIDLDGIDFYPIGSEGYSYRGIIDGNGYTIQNFSYVESRDKYRQYVGMFRYTRGLQVEIKNLTLTNSSIVNEVPWGIRDNIGPVGLFVGMFRDGIVFNCHVENSSLAVSCAAGGLIGSNVYGIVEGCTSSATITGDDDAMGGLLGGNHEGLVFNCHSSGDVLGGQFSYRLGGLVGSNDGIMEFCTASGKVSSLGNDIGGLVGQNWGLIRACRASGDVTGWSSVGGLVGENIGPLVASCSYGDVFGRNPSMGDSFGGLVGENIGYIAHTYALGSVTGNENVGGLVGHNTYYPIVHGEIETSYSTGLVSGNKNVGGLVFKGSPSATTSNDCFWDIETSGQSSSDGGLGKTTAEMQTASTFIEAGWDFVDETANGTEDIWWILEGQDYPRLWWELDAEN